MLSANSSALLGADHLYQYITTVSPLTELVWRKVVLRFTRATPASTQEDYAQFSLHFVQLDSGAVNPVWVDTDYPLVETHLNTMMTTLKTVMSNTHSWADLRWYQMSFAQDTPPGTTVNSVPPPGKTSWDRFEPSGPPIRVSPGTGAGTLVGAALPYQVALSVTLKVAGPKHWGRVYVPGLTTAAIDGTTGRWTSAIQTTVTDAFHDMAVSTAGSGFHVVVPTTQIDQKFQFALSTVTDFQSDDIVDIIRRRRPRTVVRRYIGV